MRYSGSMKRVLASLVMIFSFVIALAFVAPYLIQTSPLLTVVLIIVMLGVWTYLRVWREQREQDEEVMRRWFPRGPKK